jgi:hypothetical protein
LAFALKERMLPGAPSYGFTERVGYSIAAQIRPESLTQRTPEPAKNCVILSKARRAQSKDLRFR